MLRRFVDLVLASASPRRARLLREAGFAVCVVAPDVDESVPPRTPPDEAAVLLALRKARAVDAGDAWVLGADTLIDLDGAILGKPEDAADARRILRALSGRAHRVITGVVLRRGAREWTGRAVTRVTFRHLTDDELDAYVATGEPFGKAGAYGIQARAKAFVASVEGPVDNVTGLPMDVVRELLARARA